MSLIINGERIDNGLLDQEFAQIKSYFESLGNVSCCERDDEFRGYAKDNVVAKVLLAQEAASRIETTPDSEVSAAMDRLKQEHGGDDQFYAAIGAGPDQESAIREQLEMELRVNRLVDQFCVADPEPSDQQLHQFYEQQIEQFTSREQVKASHILKSPKRSEDRQTAFDELRRLREQLLDGADFETLAREHTEKPKAEVDLGYFSQGDLMPEFEMMAFSMRVGEISPVFVSPGGFHLVKLTARKPATAQPFDQVREQVHQRLLEDRRSQRMQELVEQLRNRATIEQANDDQGEN